MTKRLSQWKASFEYEAKRFGFSMEGNDRFGCEWYELSFTGDNVALTTENAYIKVPVVKAAQALWGLPRMDLTTLELSNILEGLK